MAIKNDKKQIHIDKYYIFIGVLAALKLILMGMFSSDYQDRLFMPFVTWFVKNKGNPYEYFMDLGAANAFPYPPGMLFIQSAGAVLLEVSGMTTVFLKNLLFKLPSFLLDFAGLHYLVKLFPMKRRYAAVVWFASPIVLYAVYMHGQLDLIPTVFLLGSVYYFSSKESHRYLKGTAFMVLALLMKLHVLAVLPLVFMYLHKRDGMRNAAIFAVSCMAGTVAGMLPFWSKGFCSMVLMNEEQRAVTFVVLRFAFLEVYAAIGAVLLLYLSAFSIHIMNRSLFLSMNGMVFAVFLVFCPPMPGWYVWVVPYIAFFFMLVDLGKYKNIAIYMFFNVLYLTYFVFFHDRGMTDLSCMGKGLSCIKIADSGWRNLVFTLLSATLVSIVYSMYQLGITSNSLYKRRNIPFTIGIAGDSGAGKSTLIELVKRLLGEGNLLYIEGDGDHRWERGNEQWQEFTHLNPKANYLYRQAQDLRQLRAGNAVRRVEYDHDTGRFTNAKRMKPKSYVMLCGLHAMYLPQSRKYLDLKVYMDVDESLRRYWKIQRDASHRGYTKEEVLRQIEERMADAEKYIYPQKAYADVWIRYYDNTLKDYMEDGHVVRMSLCITVSAALNMEALVDILDESGIVAEHDYSQDLKRQTLDIDSAAFEGHALFTAETAAKLIPQLEEISGEKLEAANDMEGILELVLLMCISAKMRGEI